VGGWVSHPIELATWARNEHELEAPLPEVVGAWGLEIGSESPTYGLAQEGDLLLLVLGAEPEGIFAVEVLHEVDAQPPWVPPPASMGRWRPPPGLGVRAGDVVLVHQVGLSPGWVWEALSPAGPEWFPWVARLEVVSEAQLRPASISAALYAYDQHDVRWELMVLHKPSDPSLPRAVGCAEPQDAGCEPRYFLLYDLPDLTPSRISSRAFWTGRDPGQWRERVAEAVERGGAVARVAPSRGETLPDGSCRFSMRVVEAATGPLAPGESVTVDMDRVWCWLDLGRPLDGWTTLLPADDGTWWAPAWWSTEGEDVRPASPYVPVPPALRTGDPVVVEPKWIEGSNLFPAAWTRGTGALLGPAVCTVP